MLHYNDWETMEGISSVKDCGSGRKFCMRMRRPKRRQGELFGKQFEGVHWEKRKDCEEDVMESWTMGRKVFLFESFVYI